MVDWDLRYKSAVWSIEWLQGLHDDCKPLIIHRLLELLTNSEIEKLVN